MKNVSAYMALRNMVAPDIMNLHVLSNVYPTPPICKKTLKSWPIDSTSGHLVHTAIARYRSFAAAAVISFAHVNK